MQSGKPPSGNTLSHYNTLELAQSGPVPPSSRLRAGPIESEWRGTFRWGKDYQSDKILTNHFTPPGPPTAIRTGRRLNLVGTD
jgi:hypothetical protein